MMFAFFFAVLIGISLGLIGGGGSILTVPVLVYIAGIKATEAMSYSLFVVGTTAWLGTFQKSLAGQINVRVALSFFFPSMLVVYLTRHYVLPALPEVWVDTLYFMLKKDKALMLIFASLMLLSARAMIQVRDLPDTLPTRFKLTQIVGKAVLVGFLTGFVGAGGGFLIVPTLVLLVGLEMKVAVGTSLFVIAINSTIGFLTDLGKASQIRWDFLLIFAGLALVGSWIGNRLTNTISNTKLKKIFGWFVLIMGIVIWILELL